MSKLLHIVMLHNRYQYAGGEDVAMGADIELLREYGHRVTLIEFDNEIIKQYSKLDKLKLFAETAWNFRVYREIRSQLQALRPDLVHVQNFFPLFSPSVHAAARSLNIPTIQHLHNFRLGCLNGYLLRDGKVCESCVGKNPWRGVVHKCYRDSRIASLAVWGMLTLNRWRRTWWRDVDSFITPSNFAAAKLKEIGIPSDRLYVKPNLVNLKDDATSLLESPAQDAEPKALSVTNLRGICTSPVFLFIGRLSAQKGLNTLLQAWADLNMADWQLKIVGEGAERLNLEQFADRAGLKNIEFLGYLTPPEITSVMRSAVALVVPSQSYETFGLVAIEAFARGKPVLASDLGALSELVSSGHNGFLIPHDQVSAWTELLLWCGTHDQEMQNMGANAYLTYQQIYTRSANYQKLMAIYDRVLNTAKNP
jgi:glycosyltransferase involved in cell wall biosynthesis